MPYLQHDKKNVLHNNTTAPSFFCFQRVLMCTETSIFYVFFLKCCCAIKLILFNGLVLHPKKINVDARGDKIPPVCWRIFNSATCNRDTCSTVLVITIVLMTNSLLIYPQPLW